MLVNIAVATPDYPRTLSEALDRVASLSKTAANSGARIICFPESYLPGYPIEGFTREHCTKEELGAALQRVCSIAREAGIAIIIPMDWHSSEGFVNVAQVIDDSGALLGYQTKNQLDPSEDNIWQAGSQRHVFEIDGLRFGIAICHEGFRYPETVRWMARQGAQIVFHPNLSGSNSGTHKPTEWGSKDNPYYEKAQMMRALENTIYFASSNYNFSHSESASAIIDPSGACIAYQPYGEAGVLVATIDTDKATGLLARRLRPELYEYPVSLPG